MERLQVYILFVVILHSIAVEFACEGQNVGTSCSANDHEALLDFKNGLNDPENRLSSWQGRDCCKWRGIGCSNTTGSVIKIDLHNPFPVNSADVTRYGFWNLSGEIRPSLLKIQSLQYLDLSLNTFGGIPIPRFVGSLKNLEYLNLSKAGFFGTIPPTLGNLSHLQYLDVSSEFSAVTVESFQWVTYLVSLKHLGMNQVDLSMVGSSWLKMLNQLPHLTALRLSSCGLSGSISHLTPVNFTSLAFIDLSFNSFNSMFPSWLVNSSNLEYIDVSNSGLRGRIPLGISEIPRLRYLNLALNKNLSANCHELFRGSWKQIEVLDLGSNKLHGKVPRSIGNMTHLTHFNLLLNNIEGGIPSTIGGLCKLINFDLSGNNLTGSLPEILEGAEKCDSKRPLPSLMYLKLSINGLVGKIPEWLGQLKNLQQLGLTSNFFEGPIPASLGTLQNLTNLGLSGNQLTGTLPQSFGQLSELSVLDVSSNLLTGTLTEVHFSNLSKMKILDLSSNSFTLNVNPNWIPPFQIRNLDMGSCHLGPSFPTWLKSQKELMFLDISNASISDSIPGWFWDISSNLSLLNCSFNQLNGNLPNPLPIFPFADIDLSSNLFKGTIPLPTVPIELLDLSNNKFQGLIPQNISEVMPDLIFLSLSGNEILGEIPATIGMMTLLQVIDLSNNKLTGSISSSIGECSYLKALDLGNNNLSGLISSSLGQLRQLQSLHLNDNKFSGRIPLSFKNLSNLETLDLGNNRLSGNIPSWISDGVPNLRILRLRSNSFSGELPLGMSNLSSLQVLDLAENNLTGTVPTSIGNLKAMVQEQKVNKYLLYGKYRGLYYEESLRVNLKSQFQKYTKTLSLLISIDLSRNNLYGALPVEMTKLHGLIVLNLSGNQISGQIPENISSLRQLASLDLSSNKLSGVIPSSMGLMSFLSFLNFSNNNISGMVPYKGQMTTFTESAFEGNPHLCGAPLLLLCQNGNSNNTTVLENDSSDEFPDKWFYVSVGLGFLAGILVPYCILLVRKPWKRAYFSFLDRVIDRFVSTRSNRITGNRVTSRQQQTIRSKR
ncbi:receptor-like protein EIX1 [Nicotiana tomentosiformis]|uniref:receptor-like protein EIX1 n=1 Tax=Nicotiana tomentosiformis TaxID=4098 RepID=UPI00051ADAB8|nr:receptor-like protein EIX2 [Nicotiana tomentosiformis]